MYNNAMLELAKYLTILVLEFAPNFHPQTLHHIYSQPINPNKPIRSKEAITKRINIFINLPNCQLKRV